MILRYNETAKDATLTPSSASTNYPVSNIVDSQLTTLYRSDLSSSINIVFDCGVPVPVSSIVIDKHNITENVSILKLEAHSSDYWTPPLFSVDLDWDSDKITNDFDTESYRYWRLVIEDLTNPDGYIEMGRVWIGERYITPGIGVSVPDEKQSLSVKTYGLGGKSFGDIRDQRTRTVIRFPKLSESEKAIIRDWFGVSDTVIPFYITFDKAGQTIGTLYATINQDSVRFTRLGNTSFHSAVIEIIEEL